MSDILRHHPAARSHIARAYPDARPRAGRAPITRHIAGLGGRCTCDNADALLPIALSGGIGGPAVSLFVWHGAATAGVGAAATTTAWGWHGGGVAGPGTPCCWSANRHAPFDDTATGTFAIAIPAGTMGTWPRR